MPEAAHPERPYIGPQSDVWLGDVVEVWTQFGAVSEEERALLVEPLGFELPRAVGLGKVQPAGSSAPMSQLPEAPSQAAPTADLNQLNSSALQAVPMSVLDRKEPDPRREPDWVRHALPLEQERVEHALFRPPYESLFETRWTRALVGAVTATRAEDGPIDLTAVIQSLARCRPLLNLPRRKILTLRKGVQLVLDYSESMMPFFRDMEELARRIVEIVGRDRTTILKIYGDILRKRNWRKKSNWLLEGGAPPPAVPLLIVSDLGLTRDAVLRDGTRPWGWMEIAQRLSRSECDVAAIVPLPLSRVPAALLRSVNILSWDRSTTVLQARHLTTNAYSSHKR
jgi:hypothetical protein